MVRRKKGEKQAVNAAKKEKRVREVVGAEEVKEVKVKEEETMTENVEDELTEKLKTLLERDRSGVSFVCECECNLLILNTLPFHYVSV